jgi:hypothetical protein
LPLQGRAGSAAPAPAIPRRLLADTRRRGPRADTSARLPRLAGRGRGRAIGVLAGAEDFDGQLGERYGYANRATPDDEFDDFVTASATQAQADGYPRK